MRITMFKNLLDTDTPFYVDDKQVINRIRNGKVKEKIISLRSQQDESIQSTKKQQLPCICWSGEFMYRDDKGQTSHSGLMVLDFDSKIEKGFFVTNQSDWLSRHDGAKLVTPQPKGDKAPKSGTVALLIVDPAAFRDSLKQYPFIYTAFISPTGTGVKAVVKVPPVISQHRGHYDALIQLFEVLDSTSINPSRVCFESYDPDIWVNDDVQTFVDYIVPDDKPPVQPVVHNGRVETDYSKLNICARMIRRAVDGEKHPELLKASKLAGGYVASGTVEEEEAFRILCHEIDAKPDIKNRDLAYKTIRDGIEYGKRQPIYEQVPEGMPAQKSTTTNGIKLLSGCYSTMRHQFRHGKRRGEPTGFTVLDEHFTWKRMDLTLFSGKPNSGKSVLVMQLALVRAKLDGVKWAVFSPESYPEDEFYDDLIHSIVGKSVDPMYHNQMSEEEYDEAAKFVNEHFFYVYPDSQHTTEEVESNFIYCIKEFGCTGVIADPYNQFRHDLNGKRDDQYLDEWLTNRKRFAITHNVDYVIVSHPKTMVKKDGKYEPVDFYDLAGGAMWSNKIDNFISVHRPNQFSNPKDTTVEVHVKKIKKQKLVGIPGMVVFNFDRATNRYYDEVGRSPLDAVPPQPKIEPKNYHNSFPSTDLSGWDIKPTLPQEFVNQNDSDDVPF